MNFDSSEKQIFKSFSCTKIRKDSKWTETSWNEVMLSSNSNNFSRLIFPYRVHNQTDFDSHLLTEEALFTRAFLRRVSRFKYLQEFEVTYQ